MSVVAMFHRLQAGVDWSQQMRPLWGPLGGFLMASRTLDRDLAVAQSHPDKFTRQSRLEMSIATINSARSYLDEIEIGVTQALEALKREAE